MPPQSDASNKIVSRANSRHHRHTREGKQVYSAQPHATNSDGRQRNDSKPCSTHALHLPNAQDEPRPWLARLVPLGARDVTAMVVGSGALLGGLSFGAG